MKKLLIIALSAAALSLQAQTEDDLQLFHTYGLHGTPRYVSMGGAFTALGADLSALSINPAAGSVFRTDNFGISLGLQNQSNQLRFLDNGFQNSDFNFLFENVGLVKKFGNPKNQLAFGITVNKLADFNTDFNVAGEQAVVLDNNGAILGYPTLGEYWLMRSGGPNNNFEETIGDLENSGLYEEASAASATVLLHDSLGVHDIGYSPDNESQVAYSFRESGSLGETAITLGGQVNEHLHIGGGIGIPSLSYNSVSSLTESGFADTSFFESYTLNRHNQIAATGINLKVGLIYRINQSVRIGASYQSPSWYNVNQVYSLYVDAYEPDGKQWLGNEYTYGNINYALKTPAIYRAGLAVIFGKQGLVSVDYEYSDPRQTTVRAKDGGDYEDYEQTFAEITQSASTLKAGGEYRIGPTYVRAGYQYRAANFQNEDLYSSSRNIWSLGFGYKNQNFGIDLAYAHTTYSQSYFVHPYLTETDYGTDVYRGLTTTDITKGNVLVGVNFNF